MNRRTKRWFWTIGILLLAVGAVGTTWLLSVRESYSLVAEIEPRGAEHEDLRERLAETTWRLVLRNDGTFLVDSPFMMSPEGPPFTAPYRMENGTSGGFAPDFYFVPQMREDDALVGNYRIDGDKLTLIRPPYDSGCINISSEPRTRTLKFVGNAVVDEMPEIPGVRLTWVADG